MVEPHSQVLRAIAYIGWRLNALLFRNGQDPWFGHPDYVIMESYQHEIQPLTRIYRLPRCSGAFVKVGSDGQKANSASVLLFRC